MVVFQGCIRGNIPFQPGSAGLIPSVAASAGTKPGNRPGVAEVGEAEVLSQFTLTEVASAASTGLHRLGLAFPKGTVISGQILHAEISGTPILSAMIESNYWSDGSLRKTVLLVDAGSFSADQAKTIDITAVASSQAASSFDPWDFITNLADDLTVEITNHTGSTDNTNVGNLTFSLKTAIATSTRREIQADTDLFVRTFAWQQVGDDQHLICLWYVDFWLDTDGETVLAFEATPVLSQHWWVDDPFGSAQTKQERNYDAEFLSGASSIADYTGLNHAYYCQFAFLRTSDDTNHARRFWFDQGSSAMPTLSIAYSTDTRIGMMKAGYIPPLDLSTTYSGNLYNDPSSTQNGGVTSTYTPLGRQGHKEAINAPGAYVGRGVITDPDGKAITGQTAALWRQARVMAQASLSVYHHIKDHRTASGGAFSGDAGLGLFPQEFSTLGAQSYTGLASEGVFVKGTGSDLADDAPNNAVNATTITGEFRAWDQAHHTVYGYMMAFVEGERYLFDAIVDQLNHVNVEGSYDGFFGNPQILWRIDNSSRKTDLGLPTNSYGFVYIRHRQEREFGWTVLGFDHVYALMADNDRHRPWMDNALVVANDWLSDSVDPDNLPASQLTTGTVWMRNPPLISSFMNTMTAQCFSRSILLHDGAYAGFIEYERLLMRWFRDTAINAPICLGAQDHLVVTDDEDAQEYIGRTDRYTNSGQTVIDNTDLPGTLFNDQNHFEDGVIPAVDDVCRFAVATSATPLPSGANLGVDYHVVEVQSTGTNDANVKIAETQGGAAIEVTSGQPNTRLLYKLPGHFQNQLGDNGTTVPNDDDNFTIAQAALEYHYGRGGAEISSSDMTTIRNFFSPKSYSNYAPWNLDGDNLL